MPLFFAALLLLLAGGLASILLGSRESALRAASACIMAASALGFLFALHVLWNGAALTARLPLALPIGVCEFTVDSLSAVFMLPGFLLAGIGGALLPGRMRLLQKESSLPLHFGLHGFFYCLLALGMFLTMAASDAVLFVISWEIMSLAPFFLIRPVDRGRKERYAAWIYLVAAHLGALPLLFLFADMIVEAGGTSFALFSTFADWRAPGLLFLLALTGFGVKMGLVPLHVWMPETYSPAPAHVAALMSGGMLNVGLYGLVRLIMLVGPADVWWAYALMGAGAFSGIAAILLGLAQPEVKRVLAYSSAENMGVITMALGGGLLAGMHGAMTAAALLLGGALLHMWNHSLFKSLLFLGAGAVEERTGDTSLRMLGGLQKRLPLTGGCFALASAAIAGIPPFNGFMGEMLIYIGFASGGLASRGQEGGLAFWLGFGALGTIAGMAVFAFARLYGLAFLGAPRSAKPLEARDPEPLFKKAMLLLAGLCVAMSLAGPVVFEGLAPEVRRLAASALPLRAQPDGGPAVRVTADARPSADAPSPAMTALSEEELRAGKRPPQPVAFAPADFAFVSRALRWYAVAGAALVALCGLAAFARKRAVDRAGQRAGLTWDCGYAFPTPRMQYTGGSFAHSFATILRPLGRARVTPPRLEALFPSRVTADMQAPDWATHLWTTLVFHPVARLAEAAKSLQFGLVNMYVLYIFIALIAALVWALEWS